ncbi:MAG: hypothetical protein LUD02_05035 [Tannerellaceae bacterium]|nr:hypothetical protein [Tannerellaceae bacterium]MCD8263589.1 hypothetical protein [Tannerellaceae bacterium]
MNTFIIRRACRRVTVDPAGTAILTDEIYACLETTPAQTPPFVQQVINRQLEEVKQLKGCCFGYRYLTGKLEDNRYLVLEGRRCNVGAIIHNQLKKAATLSSWLPRLVPGQTVG